VIENVFTMGRTMYDNVRVRMVSIGGNELKYV